METELDDFRNFLWLVWQHIALPDPTDVQYDIADFLQSGPRRRIIEAFRGVGKSFITGGYVCWRLLQDPQKKFLVVSASKDRADAFSIFVKRLIQEMPLLQHLRPRPELGHRDSNIAFDVGPATVDQSPSVKSVGITGQITGSRADEIIADDVESLNNSATPDQRLKLAERIKEFDAVLKPGGTITYLGTPQTEFSIYNELQNRGYECRIWPARYPDRKRRETYGVRLAPLIAGRLDEDPDLVGKTTDPKRFSDLDLAEREASYGKSGFALQFYLDTSLSDMERYPLKLSDLMVTAVNPEFGFARAIWASSPDLSYDGLPMVGFNGDRFYRPMDLQKPMVEYKGAVMTIDPSGRGKDETSYAVVKQLNGWLYLTASGGLKGGYEPETLRALAVIAKTHQVKHVLVEDNFGDGMFTALLTPVMSKVYPVTIEGVHSKGQKELRIIDTLEPVLNQHRLIVSEDVVRADHREGDDVRRSLFYQLTRITRDRRSLSHDDRLDALAMAIAYWSEAMAIDADRAVEDLEEQKLEKELQDFVEGLSLVAAIHGVRETDLRPERTWCNPQGISRG